MALVGALIFWLTSIFQSDKQSPWITDQSILKVIWESPDQIVCKDDLADRYGISKFVASNRLMRLYTAGVLKSFMANSTKSYYEISYEEDLKFDDCSKPELDFETLLQLFQKNEYRLSFAKIIAGTGFDLRAVKQAIRFFKKEQVVMTITDPITHKQSILLKEPHRSKASHYTMIPQIEEPDASLDLYS